MISLRGIEPEDSVAGPALARTVAQVTVDGMFPNAEMKKKIEDKWVGLHTRVTGLLAGRAIHVGDPGPNVTYGVVTSGPLEIADPEVPAPGQLSASGPGQSSSEIVVHGEVIGRTEVAVPGGDVELAAELQRQRKDLRLRLAESGLSERTCREAIADIRAELRHLEQPDALLARPPDRQAEVEIADLLRQRRGLRGKLIATQLSEDFYNDEVADINAELKDLGWSQ
jgi:hypothetical protein